MNQMFAIEIYLKKKEKSTGVSGHVNLVFVV
jgi:hypothetical protein